MKRTPKNCIIEVHSENCMRSYYFKSWRTALKAINLCYPTESQEREPFQFGGVEKGLKVIVDYSDWTGKKQVFYLYPRQFSTRLE